MTKHTTKWTILAATLGGVLSLGAWAAPVAAGQTGGSEMSKTVTPTGGSQAELTHATAMVTAIDRSARTATLKREDGEEVTISVPSDVKAYDKLKVGDRVDVDYYQSLAVEILPPGAKPSSSTKSARSMEATSGVTGKQYTVSATVMSVDAAANTVTFKGPHGKIRTIAVQDPQMQAKLPSLKPGQVVQFTYTEATAASIRPASGQ
jgi:Cu/Ag efflux protein CusF